MGYDYGFLLSLVKLPPSFPKEPDHRDLGKLNEWYGKVIDFAKEIGKVCKKLEKENEWFPTFGEIERGGSGSYSCGDTDKLWPELFKLTALFPGTVFAVYFFYWDCTCLSVLTFSDNTKIREDHENREQIKIGPYTISCNYDFGGACVPNDLTEYIHKDPGFEFEYRKLNIDSSTNSSTDSFTDSSTSDLNKYMKDDEGYVMVTFERKTDKF